MSPTRGLSPLHPHGTRTLNTCGGRCGRRRASGRRPSRTDNATRHSHRHSTGRGLPCHPLAPLRGCAMSTPADLILGPVIRTRYLGSTYAKGSRVIADHKRDRHVTWRKTLQWDCALSSQENHLAAAEALLASWPHENTLRIVARGHDADAYYFLCQSQS